MKKIVEQQIFQDLEVASVFYFRLKDEEGNVTWTNKFLVPVEDIIKQNLEADYNKRTI